MANNRIYNYIVRIRNSDERTKRRAVTIASSFAMIVVILLWVVYLNLTLPTLAIPKDSVQSTGQNNIASETAQIDSDNSFFSVIARGASIIGKNITSQFVSIKDGVVNEFSKIGGLVTKKNELLVKPSNTKFEPNAALEQIPPTKLPE